MLYVGLGHTQACFILPATLTLARQRLSASLGSDVEIAGRLPLLEQVSSPYSQGQVLRGSSSLSNPEKPSGEPKRSSPLSSNTIHSSLSSLRRRLFPDMGKILQHDGLKFLKEGERGKQNKCICLTSSTDPLVEPCTILRAGLELF